MRKLLNPFCLSAAFVSFSEVLGKTKVNDTLKGGMIGAMWYSAMLDLHDEWNRKMPFGESKCSRFMRIGEPIAKTMILTYSAALDFIVEAAGEENQKYILIPTFTAFALITAYKGLVSYHTNKKFDAVVEAGLVSSLAGAIVGVAAGNPVVPMVSLMGGAACAFFGLAKNTKAYFSPTRENQEALLGSLNSY